MSLDPGTLTTINNIYEDVRTLTTESIPGIREELVSLSNGITINKRDIGGLLEWKDTTGTERGGEIMALTHRAEILETDAKKRSANWGEIFKMLAAIGQTLVTAYLISKFI